MELQEPPIYIVVPGQASTGATRRHPHADVPPGRGPGDRRGHHAGRPPGRAARVRAGDLRRRARDPPAPALLPVHRAERGGGRLLLRLRRHGLAAGRLALPLCKGSGWIEILGSGMVDPNVLGFVAETATTRSACRASRSAWASSGSRCCATASPTCGCSSTTTCASWSSSAHEGAAGMAARATATRGSAAAEIAERLRPDRHRARADRARGRGGRRRTSWSARCSSAEQHPDADRLTRVRGRRRLGLRAHDRVRRAQRGRGPDGGGGAARRGDARRHEAGRGRSCAA